MKAKLKKYMKSYYGKMVKHGNWFASVLFALIVVYSLLFPSTRDCYSQPITWSKIYSPTAQSDLAYYICNSNSFYYIVGQAFNTGYLIKINEYGDTLWSIMSTAIGGPILGTSEGGCISIASSDSLRVVKISPQGNITLNKVISPIQCTIVNLKNTADGKYIACGNRITQSDGVVVKFDSNGNLQWLKQYPTGGQKSLSSMDELPNGGFIVTGTNRDYVADTSRTLLMRIDQFGNIVWEKKYKVYNKPASGGFIKKTNNGIFIGGSTLDTSNVIENERVYFIRTDTSGNVRFTKLFPNNRRDFYITSQYLNENRFVFSSLVFSQIISGDTATNKVMITDTLGNIIVSKNFYSPLFVNSFYTITKALNGDLIFAGYTRVILRSDDFLICRVDSNLIGPPISIEILSNHLPQKFQLYQNYPNPFNSSTKIVFELPKNGATKLVLYDLTGREVLIILDKYLESGIYVATLSLNDFSSGVYFLELQFENELSLANKIFLIK
jgi:hypothetical protein